MEEKWAEEIKRLQEKYEVCLENKERVRSAMEQGYMDYEILELKYKRIVAENEVLKQKLLVAEQIIKERKWAEWKSDEE